MLSTTCRNSSTKISSYLRTSVSRRWYGAPPAIQALDPRRDKTVQVTHSRGVNVIHDPLLSKGKLFIYFSVAMVPNASLLRYSCMKTYTGTAFSINERERLSLRGLVPPRQQEMDKQLLRVKRNLDACETPLDKFIFLSSLQDRNETLFYKLLIQHLEELSGVIYTPTGEYITKQGSPPIIFF